MRLSDKLDYSIENIDERLNLVKKIIEENDNYIIDYYENNYNPHLNQNGVLSERSKMGRDLEKLANYLLYSSVEKEDIITEYRKKRNSYRESSINNLLNIKEYRKETNKSIIKMPKIKVNKKDRQQHKELAETGRTIDAINKLIKIGVNSKGEKLSDHEIRRLKWIRTDIQKDEIAIKNDLKGYIRFQNILSSEPDYKALSYIQFDNIEIIRILIEEYQELKEYSYEDTFGYLKIILLVFEDLVEQTDFKDYLKDILIWKIEKLSYDEMISMLKEKYNITNMTKPKLSKITRVVIPSIIAETYKRQREDWVYTYIFKGEYQTCSKCKKNYLSTIKYFSPSKLTKTGLYPVCRNCRKKK